VSLRRWRCCRPAPARTCWSLPRSQRTAVRRRRVRRRPLRFQPRRKHPPARHRRRLQFAPIIGTPVEAAAPLTERLALRARERGIAIAPSGEPQTYVLKGYFSALPEGKETTVVYVWDVLDSSGNRLHRIQGQQVAQGGNGWSSVSASTMQAIADQTMEQLAGWFGRTSG
jgi:hypothetical protein